MPIRTLADFAEYFGTTPAEAESALTQLGVPLRRFLDQTVVDMRDVADALRKGSEPGTGLDRAQETRRLLAVFKNQGCSVTSAKLHGRVRATGSYRLSNPSDPGRSTTVKIQVSSALQTGGAVHFNLATDLLRDTELDWLVLVAPPFSPNSDFMFRRQELVREAGERLKSKVFTRRLKATGFENHLRQHRQFLVLAELGLGDGDRPVVMDMGNPLPEGTSLDCRAKDSICRACKYSALCLSTAIPVEECSVCGVQRIFVKDQWVPLPAGCPRKENASLGRKCKKCADTEKRSR